MPWIVSIFDGANAVATRADLGYRIDASVMYADQQELDLARNVQEAWVHHLQSTHSALLVLTQVKMGTNQRTCSFYAQAPEEHLADMRKIAVGHGFSQVELVVEYDPSWRHFFDFLPESA
jgi:Family of unknown function (DUF695)